MKTREQIIEEALKYYDGPNSNTIHMKIFAFVLEENYDSLVDEVVGLQKIRSDDSSISEKYQKSIPQTDLIVTLK
jgi:hypothetical protein